MQPLHVTCMIHETENMLVVATMFMFIHVHAHVHPCSGSRSSIHVHVHVHILHVHVHDVYTRIRRFGPTYTQHLETVSRKES